MINQLIWTSFIVYLAVYLPILISTRLSVFRLLLMSIHRVVYLFVTRLHICPSISLDTFSLPLPSLERLSVYHDSLFTFYFVIFLTLSVLSHTLTFLFNFHVCAYPFFLFFPFLPMFSGKVTQVLVKPHMLLPIKR